MNYARKREQAAFTLVEVMIAIGIMTVGSLGVLAMHQAVSGANRTAHEMNTALAVTERWIERIDRDSLSWTAQGVNSTELTNETAYLKQIAGQVSGTAWFRPAPPAAMDEYYAADYFGIDTNVDDDIKYCTNLRVSWVRQGSSARVDIRTFWLREGHMPGSASHPNWVSGSAFRTAKCDASAADGWDLNVAPNVNVIFASTVVQWMRRDPS